MGYTNRALCYLRTNQVGPPSPPSLYPLPLPSPYPPRTSPPYSPSLSSLFPSPHLTSPNKSIISIISVISVISRVGYLIHSEKKLLPYTKCVDAIISYGIRQVGPKLSFFVCRTYCFGSTTLRLSDVFAITSNRCCAETNCHYDCVVNSNPMSVVRYFVVLPALWPTSAVVVFQPEKAIDDCSFVLSKEPKNVKALFRRSQAYKVSSAPNPHSQTLIRVLLGSLQIEKSHRNLFSTLTTSY